MVSKRRKKQRKPIGNPDRGPRNGDEKRRDPTETQR